MCMCMHVYVCVCLYMCVCVCECVVIVNVCSLSEVIVYPDSRRALTGVISVADKREIGAPSHLSRRHLSVTPFCRTFCDETDGQR